MKKGVVNPPSFISQQVIRSRYFFAKKGNSSDSGLDVVCAGREECAPDYLLKRDGFAYHAIEFIVAGEVELKWGGHTQVLTAGSVFSYEPDSVFSLRAVSKDPLIKYFIDFSGGRAATHLEESGVVPGKPDHVLPLRWTQDLFDQLIDCDRFEQESADDMARRLADTLLRRIALDRSPRGSVETAPGYDTYDRCRTYIREHFQQLRSVDEISEKCHLNRAYIARLFKAHARESPYDYLIRLKMEHASILLRHRQQPVKSAAFGVGFNDPYHFSRVFKKTFGVSPRTYAKAGLA